MAICSTTLCYPNPAGPANGIFVQKRLAEVHKRIPIRVVAPIPVCPPLRPRPAIPAADETLAPPVHWPNMFYLPGILKNLDASFYADALDAAIENDSRLRESALIDAHFVWPDGVGAWLVSRRRRLPFVCTIRGKLVSQSRNPRRREMIAEMLRDADRLIAVSQSLADLACKVADQSLNIAVIPNGVDTTIFQQSHGTSPSVEGSDSGEAKRSAVEPANSRSNPERSDMGQGELEQPCMEHGEFERSAVEPANSRFKNQEKAIHSDASLPRQERESEQNADQDQNRLLAGPAAQFPWPADRPHVISVGHYQRLKGFHRLIEAWPNVMRRCPGARLILVGGPANEPAYERELHRLAATVNASAHDATHPPITFAGRQPPETVARMLNAADCFALASDSEGWCNAIAEALACGCPVVATDVGGNREQLGDDGTLGRLVPLGDRTALAGAISDAIATPFDRTTIARAGGRRSWQQAAAECVDVYQSLLP